jgi:ATP-dependent DNA helicase PIF1
MTTPLNDDQTAALNAVKTGRNIFLTGAGGTGKSHTIRAIVAWAKATGVRYDVTAMTGCAALLLGLKAKTLHSWAGIGLGRESPASLAESIKRSRKTQRRWMDCQLLIIDEISMMTPELLEKLDFIARRVRRRPDVKFGGIQLLLAGDFCQLPPVQKPSANGGGGGDATATPTPLFAFESTAWHTLIDATHHLTKIERQPDPAFQAILTEARMGALSAASIATLQGRKGLPWATDQIRPTLIFSRNADVATINAANMDALDGEPVIFKAATIQSAATHIDAELEAQLTRLDLDAPYEPTLQLKIGAQVMLITNLDQERGLVNGSRGVILNFTSTGLPVVRFLSVSEPVTIDRATWMLPDNDQVGRAQIPLKVAYAITIHKSQGATLDCALIDIGSNTFEYGQAYVALSRVRSLEGLHIWSLNPTKIRCHPAVAAFYAVTKATAKAKATA